MIKTIFKSSGGMKKQMAWQCYLFLLPSTIGILVFTLYPMIWVASKSCYYYIGSDSLQRFVGLDNYINLFKDAEYWQTWITTFKYMFLKLPFEVPMALMLALILNKKLKGKGFFRAMYYLPNIISGAIIALIFTNMFNYFGFINAWLMKVGLIDSEISWFSTTQGAFFVLLTSTVWSCFGINVMYFISALANVPEEMYEAAKIDGAGTFTTFFKITLPMIAPVTQTILLLALNGTLHEGEFVLLLTGGAPAGSTHTVMSYIIDSFVPGFAANDVNLGYGCALSLVSSVIMCAIAIIYNKLTKKMESIY